MTTNLNTQSGSEPQDADALEQQGTEQRSAAARPFVLPEHKKYQRPADQAGQQGTEPEDEAAPSTEERPGYVLELPGDIPTAKAREWEPFIDGFSEAASAAGLPQPIAENLVQSFIDAEAALGGYGAGENAYTPEDAESTLRAYWGREAYDANMQRVWKTVKAAGSRLAQWLDDSGMGNSPSTIIALSMMDDLKLTKPQAQAELNKLMSDQKSDYFSHDDWRRKPAVARVQLLSRLANAEPPESAARPRLSTQSRQSSGDPGEKARTDARAEASKMIRDGVLTNGTPKEREAAKKRFIELTARI